MSFPVTFSMGFSLLSLKIARSSAHFKQQQEDEDLCFDGTLPVEEVGITMVLLKTKWVWVSWPWCKPHVFFRPPVPSNLNEIFIFPD